MKICSTLSQVLLPYSSLIINSVLSHCRYKWNKKETKTFFLKNIRIKNNRRMYSDAQFRALKKTTKVTWDIYSKYINIERFGNWSQRRFRIEHVWWSFYAKIVTQQAIIWSNLTIETLEQAVKNVQLRSGIFIVNFGDISHLVLVIPLLILSM